MISYMDLEQQIKKGNIHNCYALCGQDENLIKECINLIVNKSLSKDFMDLNFSKFDGSKVDEESIINACETLPFMAEKKIVVVYRAEFLEDGSTSSDREKVYKAMSKYLDDAPEHCILIMYYTFKSDREKPSSRINKLAKKCTLVKVDKLKGDLLKRKVSSVFDGIGRKIGKAELALFCTLVDNNMDIVTNEVEKLCSYTDGREITKEDIIAMMPQKSENDIFNLVDLLSQKKVRKAIDILNELLFRGDKPTHILYMVERQFKMLFDIKKGMAEGKDKDKLARELRLHPYICEKMMGQSRKFSLKQIMRNLELCLETEKRIKSSSTDTKIEMELLLVNTIMQEN